MNDSVLLEIIRLVGPVCAIAGFSLWILGRIATRSVSLLASEIRSLHDSILRLVSLIERERRE